MAAWSRRGVASTRCARSDAYDSTPVASDVPTGYAIVDGDTTLAVVDVVNRGRVHLVRGLDEDQRVYFAAAAAALLLLDPELGG
jgi:hypothetical protein